MIKITAALDKMFCRHGIPVTIKTDNGPQFIAAEFKQYCSENGIYSQLRDGPRQMAKWNDRTGH